MHKKDLIHEIKRNTCLPEPQIEQVLNAFREVVVKHLDLGFGADVTIPGFCRFYVEQRGIREYIIPATGKKIKKPPRRYPRVTFSPLVIRQLNHEEKIK